MESLISIIVPVYNTSLYLDRCIESIVNQTYKNIEIILVNDGSTDASGEVCDQWGKKDNRIIVIHKKNGGLSSARNAGIDIAKGNFIGFVDSDDCISSNMYEYLLTNLMKYDADISSVSYELWDGRKCNEKEVIEEINVFNRKEALEYYSFIGMRSLISDYSVCIKLYKKDLFQNIRFPDNKLYEDIVTNFRLLQVTKKYVKSNRVCYLYFQNPNSIVHDKFKEKDLYIIDLGKELLKLASEEKNPYLVELSEMKIARGYLSCILKMLVYGYDNSIKCIEDIVKKLVAGLRKNVWLLLKSPMPWTRKMAVLFLIPNVKVDYFLIKIVGKAR